MGRVCSTLRNNKNTFRTVVGNLKERDHLENLGADGNITSKPVLRMLWSSGSGQGPVVSFCANNETCDVSP
jgi:hypothetical protein